MDNDSSFSFVQDETAENIYEEIHQSVYESDETVLRSLFPGINQSTSDAAYRNITLQFPINKRPVPVQRSRSKRVGGCNGTSSQNTTEKRDLIIEELISTEQDYQKSLKIFLETFSQSRGCPETVNKAVLLGNMNQVVALSQKIVETLLADVKEMPYRQQTVGRCFVKMREDILRIYSNYCQNHEAAVILLREYESQSEVMAYFSEVIARMRQILGLTSVFDIGSILLKPVQRVLKYPLLLSDLLKATAPDHLDKHDLARALMFMNEVASAVNEYKRRKEIVERYKNEVDLSLGDKLSHFTLRGTKKKLNRLSQQLIGTQTVDENFNREEQKFLAVESTVSDLTADIQKCLKQYEETTVSAAQVAVTLSLMYADQSTEWELNKYIQAQNFSASRHFSKFKSEVESGILRPLESLLVMFQGPHKLIRKRQDKLLDYDNGLTKTKIVPENAQTKEECDELVLAKKTYEALNGQLIEDLAKLYSFSMSLIKSCLIYFHRLQQLLHENIQQELTQLETIKALSATEHTIDVTEDFTITHTRAVKYLLTISPTFLQQLQNKEKDVTNSQQDTTLSNSEISVLKEKYPPDKLFIVSRDFTGSDQLDLALRSGTVVGVIKDSDPAGNGKRWLVDNGVSKGFIMKDYLMQTIELQKGYQRTVSTTLPTANQPTERNTGTSTINSPTTETELNAYAVSTPASSNASASEEQIYTNMESDLSKKILGSHEGRSDTSICHYRAMFPFTARSALELTMKRGEILKVLNKSDLDGNPEWWAVENLTGESGYVPFNYLQEIS